MGNKTIVFKYGLGEFAWYVGCLPGKWDEQVLHGQIIAFGESILYKNSQGYKMYYFNTSDIPVYESLIFKSKREAERALRKYKKLTQRSENGNKTSA